MGTKPKKPVVTKVEPTRKKVPSKFLNTQEQVDGNTPLFLFGRMDWDEAGPFSWSKCDCLPAVLKKLGQMEHMTWPELHSKQGSHRRPSEGFSPEARARLRALRLDDYEDFISFRLEGRTRVWAIVEGRITLLLWWDPEHAVHPVER